MSKDQETKYKIEKDKYFRSRGSKAKILQIDCSKCGNNIAFYQKDGPGNLLRMYLDRIHACESVDGLTGITNVAQLPTIKCSECGNVIAIPMLYEPEKRFAFRVVKGSVKKTKVA